MQEITLNLTLYGLEFLIDDNISVIKCEAGNPIKPMVYEVLKEARGYLFFNPTEGGLNGYHTSLVDLVTNALLRPGIKVYILQED